MQKSSFLYDILARNKKQQNEILGIGIDSKQSDGMIISYQILITLQKIYWHP